MPIIDHESIVVIFDDENKTTSTVVCRIPTGFDPRGTATFRLEKQTIPRKEADQLSLFLIKQDKAAADLREGKRPGHR